MAHETEETSANPLLASVSISRLALLLQIHIINGLSGAQTPNPEIKLCYTQKAKSTAKSWHLIQTQGDEAQFEIQSWCPLPLLGWVPERCEGQTEYVQGQVKLCQITEMSSLYQQWSCCCVAG